MNSEATSFVIFGIGLGSFLLNADRRHSTTEANSKVTTDQRSDRQHQSIRHPRKGSSVKRRKLFASLFSLRQGNFENCPSNESNEANVDRWRCSDLIARWERFVILVGHDLIPVDLENWELYQKHCWPVIRMQQSRLKPVLAQEWMPTHGHWQWRRFCSREIVLFVSSLTERFHGPCRPLGWQD